jgi:hypothetical protein
MIQALAMTDRSTDRFLAGGRGPTSKSSGHALNACTVPKSE